MTMQPSVVYCPLRPVPIVMEAGEYERLDHFRRDYQRFVTPLLAGANLLVLGVAQIDSGGVLHEHEERGHGRGQGQGREDMPMVGYRDYAAANGSKGGHVSGELSAELPCLFQVTPCLQHLRWCASVMGGVAAASKGKARGVVGGEFPLRHIERLHMYDGRNGADSKRLLARLAANNAEKAHSGVVLLSLLQQRRVFELEVYQPAEVGTPQHDQQRGVEGDGGMARAGAILNVNGTGERRFLLTLAAESAEEREHWAAGLSALRGLCAQ
jgi:hypothetical protein